jgi:ribosomal protein S18 acetylase RimI-like enzyme
MVRPSLADVPAVAMPPGLEIRAVTRSDARAVWDAGAEIFRDHWGATDESEEGFASFVGSPKSDPSLWVVAWDGDQIAGEVLTSITDGVGYLDSVGVRRPWRRRGLGRALVAASLRLLASRGATSVGLGVDLQNQNEAARLYESVGFAIRTTSTEFRKPLVLAGSAP